MDPQFTCVDYGISGFQGSRLRNTARGRAPRSFWRSCARTWRPRRSAGSRSACGPRTGRDGSRSAFARSSHVHYTKTSFERKNTESCVGPVYQRPYALSESKSCSDILGAPEVLSFCGNGMLSVQSMLSTSLAQEHSKLCAQRAWSSPGLVAGVEADGAVPHRGSAFSGVCGRRATRWTYAQRDARSEFTNNFSEVWLRRRNPDFRPFCLAESAKYARAEVSSVGFARVLTDCNAGSVCACALVVPTTFDRFAIQCARTC